MSQTPCRNGPSCRFFQTGSCRFYHTPSTWSPQASSPSIAIPSSAPVAAASSSSSSSFGPSSPSSFGPSSPLAHDTTELGGGAVKPPSIHTDSAAKLLVIGGLASDLKGDWFANDTAKFLRGQNYTSIDLVGYDEYTAMLASQNQHAAIIVCWHETHPSFASDLRMRTVLLNFVVAGGLLFFYGPGGPKLENVFETCFHKSWKVPNLRFRPRFMFDLTLTSEAESLPVEYRVKSNPAVDVAPNESIYQLKEDVEVQKEFIGRGLAPVAIATVGSGTLVYIGDFNADEPSMNILLRLLKSPLQIQAAATV